MNAIRPPPAIRAGDTLIDLTGDGPAWKQHARVVESLYLHGVPWTDDAIEKMLDDVEPIPMTREEIDGIVKRITEAEKPCGT